MPWVGDSRTDRRCNRFRWFRPGTKQLMPVTDTDTYWGVNLYTYIKSRKIFGCPAFKDVAAQLIYPNMEARLINEAAFGLNAYTTNRKADEIRNPSKFVYCTDHVEPRVDDQSRDMFHNDGPGTLNLTHYRTGNRRDAYYFIWRHAVKFRKENANIKSGGRANILWLDGHVSWQRETTGDDFPESRYTGN